jgi:hypothetical protein
MQKREIGGATKPCCPRILADSQPHCRERSFSFHQHPPKIINNTTNITPAGITGAGGISGLSNQVRGHFEHISEARRNKSSVHSGTALEMSLAAPEDAASVLEQFVHDGILKLSMHIGRSVRVSTCD